MGVREGPIHIFYRFKRLFLRYRHGQFRRGLVDVHLRLPDFLVSGHLLYHREETGDPLVGPPDIERLRVHLSPFAEIDLVVKGTQFGVRSSGIWTIGGSREAGIPIFHWPG